MLKSGVRSIAIKGVSFVRKDQHKLTSWFDYSKPFLQRFDRICCVLKRVRGEQKIILIIGNSTKLCGFGYELFAGFISEIIKGISRFIFSKESIGSVVYIIYSFCKQVNRKPAFQSKKNCWSANFQSRFRTQCISLFDQG